MVKMSKEKNYLIAEVDITRVPGMRRELLQGGEEKRRKGGEGGEGGEGERERLFSTQSFTSGRLRRC